MLRIFSRGNVRGMCVRYSGLRVVSRGSRLHRFPGQTCGHEKGPIGPIHDAGVGRGRVSIWSATPFMDSASPGASADERRHPRRTPNIAEVLGPSRAPHPGARQVARSPPRRPGRRRSGARGARSRRAARRNARSLVAAVHRALSRALGGELGGDQDRGHGRATTPGRRSRSRSPRWRWPTRVYRHGNRAALAGLVALGVATLLIALLGDLPDAHVERAGRLERRPATPAPPRVRAPACTWRHWVRPC